MKTVEEIKAEQIAAAKRAGKEYQGRPSDEESKPAKEPAKPANRPASAAEEPAED